MLPVAAVLLAFALSGWAQERTPQPKYEMTTYVVGLILKGPKWTPEVTPEVGKIQEGHMANIRKMGETGKLIVAGPFEDGGDYRGIFVFLTDSIEEARALVSPDPAVRSGRLKVEFIRWFAGKGLKVVQ